MKIHYSVLPSTLRARFRSKGPQAARKKNERMTRMRPSAPLLHIFFTCRHSALKLRESWIPAIPRKMLRMRAPEGGTRCRRKKKKFVSNYCLNEAMLNFLCRRQYWSYQYGINFARYKQKVKAYKAGEPIPEISDTEAKKLFDKEKNNGSITERLLSHAELEQTEDHLESESSISTSSEEPPVSPKDPSPPRSSKRRKIDRDQPVKQPSPPPQLSMKGPDPDSDESASIVVEKRNKRPVRKREPKEADENLGSGDLVPTVAISSKRSSDNFSKPKRSKRKRKSENFDS